MPETDEKPAPSSDQTTDLISDFTNEHPNAAQALAIWADACSSYEAAMRQYFVMPTVYSAASSGTVLDLRSAR